MKTSSKLSSVKRVYVSIREQSKAEPVKLALQPKPPSQPARFIRKRQDRCNTPEQRNGNQEKTSVSKFIYHRSLSPYMPPKEKAFGYFCVPKDSDALLPTPPVKKEEDLCMPYELAPGTKETGAVDVYKVKNIEKLEDLNELDKFCQFEKLATSLTKPNPTVFKIEKISQHSDHSPAGKELSDPAGKTEKNFFKSQMPDPPPDLQVQTRSNFTHLRTSSGQSDVNKSASKPSDLSSNLEVKRSKRASIKNLCHNFSLNKKVLTKAQLLLPSDHKERKESTSSTLINDENTTVASRTPSPNTSQRNSRCQALSKNFKLKKDRLASEVEKHSQVKNIEKEGQEPWVSILKDLENGIALKDLPSFQQYQNSRVSVKLRRDCK